MFALSKTPFTLIRYYLGVNVFINDVYRFCEGCDSFTWKNLARFIYTHRECNRLSKSAGVDAKFFAESASKEFIGRMCTFGYLDMKNGLAFVTARIKRPFGFDFRSLNGNESGYVRMIMNLGAMSDEEFFGSEPAD